MRYAIYVEVSAFFAALKVFLTQLRRTHAQVLEGQCEGDHKLWRQCLFEIHESLSVSLYRLPFHYRNQPDIRVVTSTMSEVVRMLSESKDVSKRL